MDKWIASATLPNVGGAGNRALPIINGTHWPSQADASIECICLHKEVEK